MKHRSRHANDKDIAPLLGPFLARLAENIRNIQAARAVNDFEAIRKIAHQLKGAGASYGYPELTTLASLIEAEIAATQSLDSATPHIEALIAYTQNIENYPV